MKDPRIWANEWSPWEKFKHLCAYALLITLITLHASKCNGQELIFHQGYILAPEEKVLNVITNGPVVVKADTTFINISGMIFQIDSIVKKELKIIFKLKDGNNIVYTEDKELGPILVLKASNLRVVLWTNVVPTFQVDLP